LNVVVAPNVSATFDEVQRKYAADELPKLSKNPARMLAEPLARI
jgi:hypothetical protein